MSLIEERAGMLVQAIMESEEYQRFLKIKKEVEQNEMLCQKIDEFRQKNFQLHVTLEGEELYNAMDNFEKEYIDFRKDPLVNQFLAAELAMVRMIQQVEKTLVNAIDLGLTYTPSSDEDE